MKTIPALLASLLFAAMLAALVGCGKGTTTVTAQPYDINGVKVDIPALQETFASGTPDQQGTAREVVSAVRYGQYEKALMSLDKLVNDASLTEPQKKMVNQVIEQVKQLITKAGPCR